MTFPSGGPGYPQHNPGNNPGNQGNLGGGPQPTPQAPGTGGFPQQHPNTATPVSLSAANLTVLLSLAVTLLGLVNYFIGFSEEAAGADFTIRFLLVGGLLAALRVLPKGPATLPFAALFSVLGAFDGILAVVRVPSGGQVPGVVTVLLILGILQMLVAVAALLFEHGVLKLPASHPQQPYAQPYGQYGQHAQQGPEKQGPQGTQFAAPVTPQSTMYAPQHGQFYQQPESGAQPQQTQQPAQSPQPGAPGTPPGGFGQQG